MSATRHELAVVVRCRRVLRMRPSLPANRAHPFQIGPGGEGLSTGQDHNRGFWESSKLSAALVSSRIASAESAFMRSPRSNLTTAMRPSEPSPFSIFTKFVNS